MDNHNLDIELFINEIKNQPDIWNITAENYHDRSKKKEAWIKVCVALDPNFNNEEESVKNQKCKTLIKRWRNMKDTYWKAVKKRRQSGPNGNSTRHYIYSRQLSFLQSIRKRPRRQKLLDNESSVYIKEEKDATKEDSETSPCCNTTNTMTRKRERENDSDNLETGANNESLAPRAKPAELVTISESVNPDKSFFDSILPFVNRFNEDQKLEFRTEVLNIIKRMRKKQSD